ncbi:peroxiredoxin [Ornithinimicrobium cerasi]|uniref:Peroxiredoxin (Alkyl hydroperoxide reductase subunit C) n=1 Tax=Ornithinimicrobium cerasi TaxID=2248773 RepID=A0A285VMU1_9MICO|nr:peroxiredoxin [Ornithinimicrobium cerasi]SOC54888.1 peroxiredoxin (alkyl hydroperoxide reductase subunit C) [Ornithinimicrobium cerasi]
MILGVGSRAPDLTLPDQHHDRVSLSGLVADRHVLLVFFPAAFSSICTGELLEIQLNIDEFVNDKVQVVGVSCDPLDALRAWAALEGYRFPLLSDFWPHGEVSRAYGVLNESTGAATRGTFLVDPTMTVTWSLVHGPGEERPIGLLHEAVRDL